MKEKAEGPGFFKGGGEMGALIRNYDWKQTELGEPAGWPVSLQTTVGIILHSAFPMFLFWGKDLLCFYNDAYRPSLGSDGKHSLIGKAGKDAWPEIWDFMGPHIENVMSTGTPVWIEDQLVPIYRNGKMENVYWTFSYSPAYGDKGAIEGMLVTCIETTDKVAAVNELKESRHQLRFSMDAAELGRWELNPATNKFRGNERLKEWFGLKPDDEIPLSLALDVIAAKDREMVTAAIARALNYESGGHYDIEYTIQNPHTSKEIIVKAKGKAYFDEENKPHLFIGTLQDVTNEATIRKQLAAELDELKVIRKKMEESEVLLELTRNAVPAMIFYTDEEQRYRSYNSVFMEWFGVDAKEALGKTVREFIGEKAYENVQPHLARAYGGARVSFEMFAPSRMNEERWLHIAYTPHTNSDGKVIGVIVHATNITESKKTEFSLRASEAKFRDLILAAPAGIGLFVGRELIIENPNQTFIDIVGKGPGIVGLPLREAMPELITEGQAFLKILDDVFTTGVPFISPASLVKIVQNGVLKDNYYNISYTPIYNGRGEIYAILDIAIDVTEQVKAVKKIEEAENNLRNAIEIANLGTWTVDLVTGHTTISARLAAIYGLASTDNGHEATVGCIDEQERERVLDAYNNALQPGRGGKFEAEYHIVNAGTGKRQIIHALGQTYFNEEQVPLRIAGTVKDITIQRELQLALENEVQLRTTELAKMNEALKKKNAEEAQLNLNLKRSNAELEQFAYIASHDLQEPIRKISTFTQMLEYSIDDMSDKSKSYIAKIYNSTDRMTKLVRDVLAFSQLKEETDEFEQVDLNKILDTVKTDFELQIEQTEAIIEIADLHVIEALPMQMIQLFGNLMSNSLKYRKAGVKPVISIRGSVAKDEKVAKRMVLDRNKKYYHIEFSDNGIGFQKEYVDKIFKIFQRLHGKTEFEGTGIGLAICLRIIQNHQGHISAAVGENGGAVFNILLPVAQHRGQHMGE